MYSIYLMGWADALCVCKLTVIEQNRVSYSLLFSFISVKQFHMFMGSFYYAWGMFHKYNIHQQII